MVEPVYPSYDECLLSISTGDGGVWANNLSTLIIIKIIGKSKVKDLIKIKPRNKSLE
ncbi:hypothetical protein [Acinetobacter sp. SFB]|uniref:hypothetical protein n=1 Tax=Acinetobacter sp. SFB TaxID=1805634 RepID=UPI0012DF5626|nr:hypothetical protein [Acinetobacter sp. SFB]